jgi:signal transduction histidine kinase
MGNLSNTKGVGLGLPLSYNITNALGGELCFSSEPGGAMWVSNSDLQLRMFAISIFLNLTPEEIGSSFCHRSATCVTISWQH